MQKQNPDLLENENLQMWKDIMRYEAPQKVSEDSTEPEQSEQTQTESETPAEESQDNQTIIENESTVTNNQNNAGLIAGVTCASVGGLGALSTALTIIIKRRRK